MDEKQILHRLRDGDAQALELIIDAYSAYVYAIVKTSSIRRSSRRTVKKSYPTFSIVSGEARER